jgi:hypothetical protein
MEGSKEKRRLQHVGGERSMSFDIPYIPVKYTFDPHKSMLARAKMMAAPVLLPSYILIRPESTLLPDTEWMTKIILQLLYNEGAI